MTGLASVRTADDGRALDVTFADGGTARFHALWLRENAQDDATRHPQSGQKYRTVLDLDPSTRLDSVRIEDGRLAIAFAPDGHRTAFAPEWLADHRDAGTGTRIRGDLALWDASLPAATLARPFAHVAAGGAALAEWLGIVARYGAGILTDGPALPDTVARVAEWFGHVRATNYGRVFDVKRKAGATNLADTGLGLEVHTDNPYRDPVPGLQILHCLQSDAQGGESVLVDGFAAALELERRDPAAFATLASTRLRFAYGDASASLEARAPMLDVAADGELVGVRYNNRSLATTPMDAAAAEAFYGAYRAFASIVNDPAFEVVFRLDPGGLFLVDNRRVLHGRKGFAGDGSRWLQGCYADRDGLLSTLAVLTRNAA